MRSSSLRFSASPACRPPSPPPRSATWASARPIWTGSRNGCGTAASVYSVCGLPVTVSCRPSGSSGCGRSSATGFSASRSTPRRATPTGCVGAPTRSSPRTSSTSRGIPPGRPWTRCWITSRPGCSLATAPGSLSRRDPAPDSYDPGRTPPRAAAYGLDHRSRVQDHGDSATRAPSPGSSRVVRVIQHLVQGLPGGMPRLVDEVLGEHRVGNPAQPVGVARRGVDLDADKPVAELLAQPLEPLGRHETVTGEPQTECADAVVPHPFLDPVQIGRADAQVALLGGGDGGRQAGLAENSSEDDLVDHHRQSETTGEAHPTTPTPGPPHRSCSSPASARSHNVAGLVRPVANDTNSRDTHVQAIIRMT